MTNEDLYKRLIAHRNAGLSVADAANVEGVSYHKAYALLKGRIKAKSTPRADAGVSRHEAMPALVERVKEIWLDQSKINNLNLCVEIALLEASEKGIFVPQSTLRRWVDKAKGDEDWNGLFMQNRQVSKLQGRTATMRYDSVREIPFMAFITIDGRKCDSLVRSDDRRDPFALEGYFAREATTGYILDAFLKEGKANTRDVARLYARVIMKYGCPGLGVACDNGKEQMGGSNLLVLEAPFGQERIESYRSKAIPEFTRFFPKAISPIVNSIAHVAAFMAKAGLERGNATFQREYDAMVGRNNYIGTGRREQAHTSNRLSPVIDSATMYRDDYEAGFEYYLWSRVRDERYGPIIPYLMRRRPKALKSFSEATGMEPTIGNAFDWFMERHQPDQVTEEAVFRMFYYTEERLTRKVTKDSQISYTLNGKLHNWTCQHLDWTLTGKFVDLIIDPFKDTRAAVFYQGEFLTFAVDYDELSKRNIMQRGEAKHQLSEIRSRITKSRKAAVKPYANHTPYFIPFAPSGALSPSSPFVIEGNTPEESIFEKTNTRIERHFDPGDTLDEDAQYLLHKYLRRPTQ